MKKLLIHTVAVVLVLFLTSRASAQKESMKRASLTAWEGMAVAGYVNQGSYVNFGGPSVRLIRKPWSFGFGILPTMRIKKDNAVKDAPKNSAVMPTAGFGFTFAYKHLVMQVPFYYNAKTSVSNGKWLPGIGLGFKL